MISNQLIDQLQGLNRAEKLRIVQFLVNELARTETQAEIADAEYEVWSPQDDGNVASTLMQLLEQDRQHGV